MVGVSLQGRGGHLGADGGSTLGDSLSASSLLVGNGEVEDLSEAGTLLGLALLSGETVGKILSETLGRSVVLTGDVEGIVREALVSRLGTLLSNDEAGVVLGELPENAGRDLHATI